MESGVKEQVETSRDIRLYVYNGCGCMKKWYMRHKFATVEDCEDYLSSLTNRYQFLIVEYSGKPYVSRIVKMVN
jgi:hypothetical protein